MRQPALMNTVEGHSNVTPTTTVPFTSTLTHVSICAHHTYAWRWKGEEMYMTSMTSSRTEEAWPISVGSLPLSLTSPWWLFLVVALIPCSRFCLLSLTPTALAPHRALMWKDGPGSWLLPSASRSAVCLLASPPLPELLFLAPLKTTAH